MSFIVHIGGANPYSSEITIHKDVHVNRLELLDGSPIPEEVYHAPPPRYSGCYGLPYQDHNYGAPPPPTPPASPPLQIINGHLIVEDPANIPQLAKEETVDDSITRCICEFTHDDGYMICCDKCSVWQHIDCMGIDRNNIPDSYFCEQCESRPVDVERAKMIQTCKRDEITDTSATDTDPEEAANHLASLGKKSAAALKGKVTRLKKIVPSKKKEKTSLKQKKKKDKKIKKVKENVKEVHKKLKPNVNSQSNKKVIPCPDVADPWNCSNSPWKDKFEYAVRNKYNVAVRELLPSLKINGIHADDVKQSSNRFPNQLCCVKEFKKNRLGLEATDKIPNGVAVIEYVGEIMLREHYDKDNLFYKRLQPFVMFYSKIEHLDLCIDSSSYGNDSRYVRRSCKPNSEITHFIENGDIHFVICSKKDISKGSEITIPFDYRYQDCSFCVDCACLRNNCPVSKFQKKLKNVQCRKSPIKIQRTRRKSNAAGGKDAPVRQNVFGVSVKKAPTETSVIEPIKDLIKVEVKEDKTDSKSVDKNSTAVEPEVIKPKIPRRSSVAKSAGELASKPGSRRSSFSKCTTEIVDKPEPPAEKEAVLCISTVETKHEDSSQDHHVEGSSEAEDVSAADAHHKLTREERKMEAIMKAFEKLEKREERRKEALARIEQSKKDVKPPKQEEEEDTKSPEAAKEISPEIKPETPEKTTSKRKKLRRKIRRCRRVSSGSRASDCFLSHDESSNASASLPSAPGTPVPPLNIHPSNVELLHSDAVKVLKKKHLFNEWLSEKSQDDKPPLVCKTEPLEVSVNETMFITCLPSPRNGMEYLQRRNSHSGGCGKAVESSVGSAKKRWLRQAMSSDCDNPSQIFGGSSPGLLGPLHSPGASPPDFVTPLKKRRLARESLSNDLPSNSSPSTPSPSVLQQSGLEFPTHPSEPSVTDLEDMNSNTDNIADAKLGSETFPSGSGQNNCHVESSDIDSDVDSVSAPLAGSEQEEHSMDGIETTEPSLRSEARYDLLDSSTAESGTALKSTLSQPEEEPICFADCSSEGFHINEAAHKQECVAQESVPKIDHNADKIYVVETVLACRSNISSSADETASCSSYVHSGTCISASCDEDCLKDNVNTCGVKVSEQNTFQTVEQECLVSSCSRDTVDVGVISSSHVLDVKDSMTSAESDLIDHAPPLESVECDSSISVETRVVDMTCCSSGVLKNNISVTWEEDCQVDSTTHNTENVDHLQSVGDASHTSEFNVETSISVCGSMDETSRDSAVATSDSGSTLISLSPSQAPSSSDSKPGVNSDCLDSASSLADSLLSQQTAKKKVSLLEYRKRLKEKYKEPVNSRATTSKTSSNASAVCIDHGLSLTPLPLFQPVTSSVRKHEAKGSLSKEKRREKPMSLTERLRLEFGLEDSDEEDKGNNSDMDDSTQHHVLPPPPPPVPYPAHLSVRTSAAAIGSNSRVPPLSTVGQSFSGQASVHPQSPCLPSPHPPSSLIPPPMTPPLVPFSGGGPLSSPSSSQPVGGSGVFPTISGISAPYKLPVPTTCNFPRSAAPSSFGMVPGIAPQSVQYVPQVQTHPPSPHIMQLPGAQSPSPSQPHWSAGQSPFSGNSRNGQVSGFLNKHQ